MPSRRAAHRRAHGIRTALVLTVRGLPLPCPAPIAVHDDGDMMWKATDIDQGHGDIMRLERSKKRCEGR
jgi:hypothetical protein